MKLRVTCDECESDYYSRLADEYEIEKSSDEVKE